MAAAVDVACALDVVDVLAPIGGGNVDMYIGTSIVGNIIVV